MIQLNPQAQMLTRHDRYTFPTPRRQAKSIACDDLVIVAYALLSDEEINEMDRPTLLDMVTLAQTLRGSGGARDVQDLDNPALCRVLCLIRRCFRIQVDQKTSARGAVPYFSEQP